MLLIRCPWKFEPLFYSQLLGKAKVTISRSISARIFKNFVIFCHFPVNGSAFLKLILTQNLTHIFKVVEVNLLDAVNILICNSQLKLKPDTN